MESVDRIEVRLIDGGKVVRIRKIALAASSLSGGRALYFDMECLEWLIGALREHLHDHPYGAPTLEKDFERDRIQVTHAGPDYQPLVAIFNRRLPEAPHGGRACETMSSEVAENLLAQLGRTLSSSGEIHVEEHPNTEGESDCPEGMNLDESWEETVAKMRMQMEAELAEARDRAERKGKEAFSREGWMWADNACYEHLRSPDADALERFYAAEYGDLDTVLFEAEYNYYVRYGDCSTLKAFVLEKSRLEDWS